MRSLAPSISGWIAAFSLGLALPATAQLVILETPGLTLGDDPVECVDEGSYRACESDVGSERFLSHDGLDAGDRIPLDFHLYLPPAPSSGPDGNYPLVVFIHGWSGHRNSIGGDVEVEMVPYAQSGYAVLSYSARAWGNSCGASQQFNPECVNQWNHLADSRYEVRDTQYFAGVLADELSDTGHPLIDPQRIGVTGVSYGGGQSTQLAALRNRIALLNGDLDEWTSPAGKPMQIAAAAPYWPWIDLAYSLAPNGRTLDYVVDAPYRGPTGTNPAGVEKLSYVTGLFVTGETGSVFAPPGMDPDLNAWKATIDAGEPYLEATIGPIIDELTLHRSGYYFIDPEIPPAPILFNQGWSDDLFPVSEPLRFVNRVKDLHGDLFPAKVVVSNYGHARATSVDGSYARAHARAWFDYWLRGIGSEPGPVARVRTQSCPGGALPAEFSANSWTLLTPGEVRVSNATGGTVISSAGPSSGSASTFDPIAVGNACARVADEAVPGSLSFNFLPPNNGSGGYTVLGSPTVIADIAITGTPPENAILAARLLDLDADFNELLLARGVYRPEASGQQVFQLSPMGYHIEQGHRLQIEFLAHEAPTFRQSNLSYSVTISNLEVRVPVAQKPNGTRIFAPKPNVVPAGYLPEPGSVASLMAGALALAALGRRRA